MDNRPATLSQGEISFLIWKIGLNLMFLISMFIVVWSLVGLSIAIDP